MSEKETDERSFEEKFEEAKRVENEQGAALSVANALRVIREFRPKLNLEDLGNLNERLKEEGVATRNAYNAADRAKMDRIKTKMGAGFLEPPVGSV